MNWKKSVLIPSRMVDFLGLHFDLEKAIISPQESFLVSLTQLLSPLSTSTVMPVMNFSSITSRISHFAPFIHHGRLQLKFLDQATLDPTQAILGHSITTGCRIPFSSVLVQQTGCSQGISFTSTGTQPVLFHRHLLNRLGSQLARS